MKKGLLKFSFAAGLVALGALAGALFDDDLKGVLNHLTDGEPMLEGDALILALKNYDPTHKLGKIESFKELPMQEHATVFLGDSLTERGRWSEFFQGETIYNRGIGGLTSKELLGMVDQIADTHPKRVFIMIGTNDLLLGISIGTIGQQVEVLLKELHRQSPTTQVFLQSVLPVKSESFSTPVPTDALNVRLKALSTEFQYVEYLDLVAAFGSPAGADSFYLDPVHLSHAGYLRWAAFLRENVFMSL